jgi:glycosyltransferase involved in cell wall biosynthesis
LKNLAVDVVQLGARENYAVPRMLHSKKILRCLYTDLYQKDPKRIEKLRELLPNGWKGHSLLQSLSRRSSDLPLSMVKSFNTIGYKYNLRLRRARSVLESTLIFHEFQNEISSRALQCIFDAPDAVVGFRGSELLFEGLKGRSKCILDQIDGGLAEVEIIREEQERYPDWVKRAPSNGSKNRQYSWLDIERPRLEAEWRMADVIVCNSNWSKNCLIKSGVDQEKIKVIPLAYEGSDIKTAERTGSGNELTVGFLGSLTLRKGFHLLVSAIKELKRGYKIRLIAAGACDIPDEILSSYSDIIEYRGFVGKNDLDTFFSEIDILALPSISEGFGIVQLEAMSRGVPVLASDRVGDVVRDCVDGRVVPAGDIEPIMEGLEWFIGCKDDFEALRRNARFQSKSFQLAEVAERWHMMVQSTVRNH